MKTTEIRKKYNITQKEFGETFGIPVATVKNWDARGTMPIYLYNAIEMYYKEKEQKEFWKSYAGA